MKLSSSNIKKFLIFPQKKAFLIFWETELFYILRNENPEKISYIFSEESFSYISENENLPQKKKKKKKNLYISGGTSEISETKVSLSTTSYTLPTRKNSTKGAINPLSASPAKWSKTLKQFVC